MTLTKRYRGPVPPKKIYKKYAKAFSGVRVSSAVGVVGGPQQTATRPIPPIAAFLSLLLAFDDTAKPLGVQRHGPLEQLYWGVQRRIHIRCIELFVPKSMQWAAPGQSPGLLQAGPLVLSAVCPMAFNHIGTPDTNLLRACNTFLWIPVESAIAPSVLSSGYLATTHLL